MELPLTWKEKLLKLQIGESLPVENSVQTVYSAIRYIESGATFTIRKVKVIKNGKTAKVNHVFRLQ